LKRLEEGDTRIITQACCVLHYLVSDENLLDVVFSSGLISRLSTFIQGYNLQIIEYSLWVIEKFTSDDSSIVKLASTGVIAALGVVMNSGLENVRLYSRYILKKLLRSEDDTVRIQLDALKKDNPWYAIGKNWSEIPYWSPIE
jgi:hypothetical protein